MLRPMTKIWPTPIKAVIFDNDGTLIDTEWAYTWAHKELTGHELDWELKPQLMGKSAIETCRLLVSHYNLPITPEDLVEKRTKILEHCWENLKLMPGAESLVKKLKEMNVHMAIGTSSRRPVFEQKIANHHDFYSMMDHITTGNEVTKGKPNPEVFLKSLSKWDNIKPEEVIVFEDSPLGIKAANNAGMASVFVPDPQVDVESALASQNAKATVVIPSLEKFDFSLFDWAQ
ncbi:haloacid dehalogenase-like hydrolase family protein [Histomonas meleagridis]|uniref:haloacid dehalogenase-like hydrolase family protein n=1 Tax=Histomonas meleagridis TaxID=135588 RepID=UPI003559CACD|nr:haloacid dehalogenase-like hydrolase family protein [Histomonas meleagridis]KAH0797099.1 haloacid dehalogenase-like hydrolase family protein [Histomonas meleagridis]